jgi:folate-binding protein YgfZ
MPPSLARLTSRAVIRLSGPDWRSFLQGLITQDVETMADGELRYGALLTPQGRIAEDLFILREGENALLDVPAASRETLIAKLKMYRLRAKVEIEAVPASVIARWGEVAPPGGLTWRPDPRLPDLGFRAYAATARMTDESPEAAYDAHRLRLGVADPAKDGAESDYPIELNLDLLNGIDFKKGCFVGQETTSRMHRRGQVKSRIAPIVFDGPPPAFGAEVLAGDLRAGEARGGIEGRALALLRIDRAAAGGLTVGGRAVTVDPPTWLARLFQGMADETPQSGVKLG